ERFGREVVGARSHGFADEDVRVDPLVHPFPIKQCHSHLCILPSVRKSLRNEVAGRLDLHLEHPRARIAPCEVSCLQRDNFGRFASCRVGKAFDFRGRPGAPMRANADYERVADTNTRAARPQPGRGLRRCASPTFLSRLRARTNAARIFGSSASTRSDCSVRDHATHALARLRGARDTREFRSAWGALAQQSAVAASPRRWSTKKTRSPPTNPGSRCRSRLPAIAARRARERELDTDG